MKYISFILLLCIPNLAFSQVSGLYSAPNRNYVTYDGLVTTRNLTYYVATTGSNSNTCVSLSAPCLTIQAAINKIPKRIRHAVIVKVGAGNFGGFYVDNFTLEHPADTSVGSYLTISGTLDLITPATGINTGTLTATTNVASPNTTWGSLTISGAGWTTNDLTGKMVRVDSGTGAGQVRVIATNTATSATIAGLWSPALDTTSVISLVMPSTNINTALTYPTSAIGNTPVANYSSIIISNITSNIESSASFLIEQLKFSSSGYGAYVYTDTAMRFRRNYFAVTGLEGILATKNTYLIATENSVNMPATNQIWLDGNGWNANVDARGNAGFFGGSFIGHTNGIVRTSRNYVKGPGKGTASFLFHMGSMLNWAEIIGDRYSDCGHAIRGDYNNSDSSTGNMTIQGVDITNCTLGFHLKGQAAGLIFTTSEAVTGTGNDYGMWIFNGAYAQFESNAPWNLTATIDAQVEGTTTTIAAIRAAVPRTYTQGAMMSSIREITKGTVELGGPSNFGSVFTPAKPSVIPTCSAAVPQYTSGFLVQGGGANQGPSKMCYCVSDGASSPVYTWCSLTLTTGTYTCAGGSTTVCP